MRHLLSPLLLLTLVLGGLTGCANTSKIIATGLSIELTQVQRDSNGGIKVTWKVSNPNVVSYLFSKAQLKVTLDGTAVGTIEDNSPVGLPATNQVERTGVFKPESPAAGPALEQALARGSATYQVAASVWVLIVDDDIEKISLAHSGTVPVTGQ
jgi:hypothetical protein